MSVNPVVPTNQWWNKERKCDIIQLRKAPELTDV